MIDYNKLGLSIYPDFISDEEHNSLIEEIRTELIKSQKQDRYIDRNRVLRYGSTKVCHNNYQENVFPFHINSIADRLVNNFIVSEKPDAININEYIKGDFIAPHVDREASGPIVTILSINSPAIMLFKNNKKAQETFEIVMLPKMLMQMRSVIRWKWNHSIYPVNDLRYSIVFRNKNE